jgi:hypothetical protein
LNNSKDNHSENLEESLKKNSEDLKSCVEEEEKAVEKDENMVYSL